MQNILVFFCQTISMIWHKHFLHQLFKLVENSKWERKILGKSSYKLIMDGLKVKQ